MSTTHRFYIEGVHDKSGQLKLDHHLWVHDKGLLNQWLNVLRFKPGDEVALFNDHEERLYRIAQVESSGSVLLEMITEIERRLPAKHIYLMWSLLKSDKNDWVIQKATELGVKNFVPLICDRTEKPSFNIERAKKIAIEASEQCGRADIPILREPIALVKALEEYQDITLVICEQTATANSLGLANNPPIVGVLVGPEGGWSDAEKSLFVARHLPEIKLTDLTLRAETAAILAVAKLNS
jgi:16S rRNA (uracil1498-N3)-methyltransferase